MNNVSHKKNWSMGVVQVPMETPLPPLIKSNHGDKSHTDFKKLKMWIDLTSAKLDLYEMKWPFSTMDTWKSFFLFIRNFNMTLAAPGTLGTDANMKYLCTLVREELLRHFDSLYADAEVTNPLTSEAIILGLALYFSC